MVNFFSWVLNIWFKAFNLFKNKKKVIDLTYVFRHIKGYERTIGLRNRPNTYNSVIFSTVFIRIPFNQNKFRIDGLVKIRNTDTNEYEPIVNYNTDNHRYDSNDFIYDISLDRVYNHIISNLQYLTYNLLVPIDSIQGFTYENFGNLCEYVKVTLRDQGHTEHYVAIKDMVNGIIDLFIENQDRINRVRVGNLLNNFEYSRLKMTNL